MRRLFVASIGILAPLLLLLLLLEGAARRWAPEHVIPPPKRRVAWMPYQRAPSIPGLPVEYIPYRSVLHIYPEPKRAYLGPGNRVEIRFNSQGFRDVEHAPSPPAGGHRIVVLGDSFTLGEGVHFPDIYPRRLEALLKKACNCPVDVVNLSFMGAATYHEAILLEHKGLPLSPDIVIVGFVLNDALHPAREMTDVVDNFMLFNPDLFEKGRKSNWLTRHSRLARWLFDRYRLARLRRETEAAYRSLYREEELGFRLMKQALVRMKEMTQARGAHLLVAIFPLMYDLDDSYPFRSIHRLILDLCAAEGIDAVDLFPDFRGIDARELWAHPSDHHPNERAHAIIAEALAREIERRGLLAR
ncbi:MAG: SGNH/GDSL hydrolase family protein [Deltaproteobacteria bacterium]|nr:MAG: SGNH/GDSL hydrolase family protein [Deltaproteobacteria bacterium]